MPELLIQSRICLAVIIVAGLISPRQDVLAQTRTDGAALCRLPPVASATCAGPQDDPADEDSLFGRTYNQFVFANVIYDVTRRLSTGLEVTRWKTLYHETRAGQIPADQLTPAQPGKAVTIDWMVKYEF